MNWFKPSGPCSCGCVQPPCTCPGTRRYLVLENTEPELGNEGPHDGSIYDPGTLTTRYFRVYWDYPLSLSIEMPELTCLYDSIVRYSYPGAEIPSGLPVAPFLADKSSTDTNEGSTDIGSSGILVEEYDNTYTTLITSYQFDLQLRAFWKPFISGGYFCPYFILDWVGSIAGGLSNDLPYNFSNPDPENITNFFAGVNAVSYFGVVDETCNFETCGPISVKPDHEFASILPITDRLGVSPMGVSRIYKWSIFQQ